MEQKSIFSYFTSVKQQLAPYLTDTNLTEQYAWWLLEKVTQQSRLTLITNPTLSLNTEQELLVEQWIYQITQKNKPIQYILGSVPFNDLELIIEPPILIPRPETEEWSAHIIDRLKQLSDRQVTILDLCTGSGCIGLSIAYHMPEAHVTISDISETACSLAEKNRLYNSVANVTVMQSDLFTHLPDPKHFSYDLIICNPPYIAESEKKDLDVSVLNWEDHNALFAPDNGLSIIQNIIKQAPRFIKHNKEMQAQNIPQLIIEIGYKQGSCVKQMMYDTGYNEISIHQDLKKHDRIVTGRVDYVANSRFRQKSH